MSIAAHTKSVPVEHFPLEGLLPDGYVVAVHRSCNTASLLCMEDGSPKVLYQKLFAPGEMCLLVPILATYPYYCPSEVLLASISGDTSVTKESIASCRKQLQEALDDGCWSKVIAPVRNILSRVRPKINTMGLDMVNILETGYLLRRVES